MMYKNVTLSTFLFNLCHVFNNLDLNRITISKSTSDIQTRLIQSRLNLPFGLYFADEKKKNVVAFHCKSLLSR